MNDVRNRADVAAIVEKFYLQTLKDPVIGFIFTDIAKIDLATHLPLVSDFWTDVLFPREEQSKRYTGNVLQAHVTLARQLPLRAGHFTRWLYLFNRAIDADYAGPNAERMKQRAESVANSISAALTAGKRRDMNLTLGQ
jgi:hemoglobin